MAETKPIRIPTDIDILYMRTETEQAIYVSKGRQTFGPYPVKGGLSDAARELAATFPDIWENENECGAALTVIHFAFMSKGKNARGVDYPVTGK